MKAGFMASLREGENPHPSAPSLSLPPPVTAATCLGRWGLWERIHCLLPLRSLFWLREGCREVRLPSGGVEWEASGIQVRHTGPVVEWHRCLRPRLGGRAAQLHSCGASW